MDTRPPVPSRTRGVAAPRSQATRGMGGAASRGRSTTGTKGVNHLLTVSPSADPTVYPMTTPVVKTSRATCTTWRWTTAPRTTTSGITGWGPRWAGTTAGIAAAAARPTPRMTCWSIGTQRTTRRTWSIRTHGGRARRRTFTRSTRRSATSAGACCGCRRRTTSATRGASRGNGSSTVTSSIVPPATTTW